MIGKKMSEIQTLLDNSLKADLSYTDLSKDLK